MSSRLRQLLELLPTLVRPHAAARLLMSVLFLVSGIGKLGSVDDTQKYMEAYGVPGYLLYPAAAFEIASGTALAIGLLPKQLCFALAGWCLLTATIFHAELKDQTQKIMFMKNLAMAGGFLVLADDGSSLPKVVDGHIRLPAVDEEAGHDGSSEREKR